MNVRKFAVCRRSDPPAKRSTVDWADQMTSTTLPIKDVLRGLRSGMTAGRIVIAPLGRDFPAPVRDMVDGFDRFASRLEAATSKLAHSLLDSGPAWHSDTTWTLPQLVARADGDTIFAQLAYGALGAAHRRFSDRPVLISETLAARAFGQALHASRADLAQMPAELLVQLVTGGVIARMPFDPEPGDTETDARLACIAFVLWLGADRSPGSDDNDVLDLCCDAAPFVDRQARVTPENRAALRIALADCTRLI